MRIAEEQIKIKKVLRLVSSLLYFLNNDNTFKISFHRFHYNFTL